jgi:hypothetical protein
VSRCAVLVVLVLAACTISPPFSACPDYGDNGDTCKRERALSRIMTRPRDVQASLFQL